MDLQWDPGVSSWMSNLGYNVDIALVQGGRHSVTVGCRIEGLSSWDYTQHLADGPLESEGSSKDPTDSCSQEACKGERAHVSACTDTAVREVESVFAVLEELELTF